MSTVPKPLYFPYAHPRPGQAELVNTICKGVTSGKHLCVEAANGFGKTIAALSGVLPLLQKRDFYVIYAARTHKQLDRVMEELRPLSDSTRIKGVVMRGRKSSCLNPLVVKYTTSAQLAMFVCSLLKRSGRCSYYQNLLRKLKSNEQYALDTCRKPLTGLELRKKCLSEHVCPYELVKMVIPSMSVVATTYHQIFNREISKIFFDAFGHPLSRVVLILDEAHNLPRLAVELASSRLSLYSIRQAVSESKRYGFSLVSKFVSTIEQIMQEYLRSSSESEIILEPSVFINQVVSRSKINNFHDFITEIFKIGMNLVKQLLNADKPPISYMHVLARFFIQWWLSRKRSDNAHFLIRSETNPTASYLEVVALDPRWATVPILKECHSSVHLSGTLQPIKAHIDLVGLPEKTQGLSLPSPFSRDQILPLISLGVTTAMRYRTPSMLQKIAKRISEVCKATPHNVGVFVPSYSVLQSILDSDLCNLVEKKLFIETPKTSSIENDALIKAFKERANEGAVLLGVLGGRNSEGEDYPGDYMNSVVIAGFPYHLPTPRVNAKIKYYDKVFNRQGWNFGYLYPAIQRANQASGRPIRKLKDKGAIIFMDHRFKDKYKWISNWIQKELEIVPDKENAITQQLYPFWKSG